MSYFWTKIDKRSAPIIITNAAHTISHSGIGTICQVRLHEVPSHDDPSTVIITSDPPGGQVYVETTNIFPPNGRFYVNYYSGLLTFNAAQQDLAILVSYQGTGSFLFAEDINIIQTLLEAHKDRHDPNDGADPLDTATAASILAQTTAAGIGTSHSLSRADHIHGITTGTPTQIKPDDTATEGDATSFTRSNHKHSVALGTPGSIQPNDSAAEGNANSLTRSNHKHSIVTAVPGSIQPDDTAAEGSATSFSRSDHKHAIVAAVPNTIYAGDTAALGSATSFPKSDHKHGISTGTPGSIQPDDAAAEGNATSFARSNHKHSIVTVAPITIYAGDTATEGTATSFPRSDHKHGITTAIVGSIQPNDAAAEGTATSFTRSDHKHGIATATPGSIQPDDSAAEGTATSFTRSDHKHAIVTAIPTQILPDDTATEGVATSFTRSDHKHSVALGTPGSIQPDDAASAGTANSLVRSDHKHSIVAAAPTQILPDDSATEGSATSFTRSDHKHNVAIGTPGSIQPDDTAATGSANSLARSDHKHGIIAAVPGSIQPGDSAAEGSATSFTRSDHKHSITAATVASIGTGNTEGTSTSFARADHVHNHPAIAGDLHTDYSLAAGTRAYTAIVSYNNAKSFTTPLQIISKDYADALTHDGRSDTANSIAHTKYLRSDQANNTMNGNKITGLNVANPTDNSDAICKKNLDDRFGAPYGTILTLTVPGGGGKYTDLMTAVTAAVSGDTILIYPGTHSTGGVAINLDKIINFVGVGYRNQIIIRRGNTGTFINPTVTGQYYFSNLTIGSAADGATTSIILKNISATGIHVNNCYIPITFQVASGSINCYNSTVYNSVSDVNAGSTYYNCNITYASVLSNASLTLQDTSITTNLTIGDNSSTPKCYINGASYVGNIIKTLTNAALYVNGIFHTATALPAGLTLYQPAGIILSGLLANIDAGGKTITNLADPTGGADQQAATKKYVDDAGLGTLNNVLYVFRWSIPGTLAVANNQGPWHIVPHAMEITGCSVVVKTPSTVTVVTIDLEKDTVAKGGGGGPVWNTVFDTLSTIDANEYTSESAITPCVIKAATKNLVKGDLLKLNIDTVGTTAAADLTVELICKVALF